MRASDNSSQNGELSRRYFQDVLAKRKNIENWPGMLISAVPAYFDGEATEVRRYCADKLLQGREAAEAQARESEYRRQQQAILDNPDAVEEDRQYARNYLSGCE
jgi:Zn/Cd-binding protein ZinT